MRESSGKGFVLGKQLFIELWSLLGFEAMICEGSADFPACYKKLMKDEVAFVLVESDWFKNIPEFYRRNFKSGDGPVWVEMPSLKGSVKNWE